MDRRVADRIIVKNNNRMDGHQLVLGKQTLDRP